MWQCRCGSHVFWLYSTGIACCAECEMDALAMNGYWHVPAADQPPGEVVAFTRAAGESAFCATAETAAPTV